MNRAEGTDAGFAVHVLGPLEVVGGGRTVRVRGPRLQALLAALALVPDRPVSAEELAETLWDGEPPANARQTLQGYVHRLRNTLEIAGGDQRLLTDEGAYRLAVEPDQVDSVRFERLVGEARGRLRRDPAVASRLLSEALGMCRGPILQDVLHVRFGQAEADRLDAIRRQAVADKAVADELSGPSRPSGPSGRDGNQVQAALGSEPPARRRSPMLMGRETERAVLTEALGAAARGRPSVIVVAGAAGIGKSRLVEDLTVTAGGGGPVVLTGECSSVPDGQVPFAALAQALRRYLAAAGPSAAKELLSVSLGGLARVVPEVAPADQQAVDEREGVLQPELLRRLLRALAWLARSKPVVLVLEDIHWADPSTAGFVEFLGRNLVDQRVLLIVTARSDELHPRHPRWHFMAELQRSPLVRRFDLEPLDPASAAELVGALLGPSPDPCLVERIVTRSGGNPLFIEALVEGHRDGTSLPSTLRELLVARTDALGPAAATCLRLLAVAGRPLDHSVLANASQLSGAALLDGLRAAVDHRLVVPDDEAYRVGHALVAEALLSDLLPGERIALHRQLACALTRDGADSAEVAHHWLAADNPAEALPALVRAAEVAERALSHSEAVNLYERAIAIWNRVPDASERADVDLASLFERAAEAALVADRNTHIGSTLRYQRAMELTEAALSHLDVDRNPARAGLLHAKLGAYHIQLGRDGGVHTAESLRLLPGPVSAERIQALIYYADGLLEGLRYREALEPATEALEAAEALGDSTLEIRARTILGWTLGYIGDVSGASTNLRRAVELADRAGSGEEVLLALNRLWAVLAANDRHDEALAVNRETALTAQRYGLSERTRPVELTRNAMRLYVQGQWDECEAVLDEIDRQCPGAWLRHIIRTMIAAARGDEQAVHANIARASERELSYEQAISLAEAEAHLALWLGRPEQARATVDAALTGLEPLEPPDYVGPLCLIGIRAEADRAERARHEHRLNDVERAVTRAGPLIQRLRRFSTEIPLPPWMRAVVATGEAEAARVHGRPAPELWHDALAAWRVAGRTQPVAWTQWRTAQAILECGGGRTDAAALVASALATARRLGMRPLQGRLEGLVAEHRLEPDVDAAVAASADS